VETSASFEARYAPLSYPTEGGVLAEPWWTYTGTKLETVDTAKENLQLNGTPLLGIKHLPQRNETVLYN
jgi:hypothetical protein